MGNKEYFEEPMISVGHSKYIGTIPGNLMIREQIEYYLLLELQNKKIVTLPDKDAIYNPIIIRIDTPNDKKIPITYNEQRNFDIEGLSPNIIIISPQPSERVNTKDLFIALSYFGEKDVDPRKVKVYLDGMDVSNRADIDSTYLSLQSEFVPPGIHTVTINISNAYGQKFDDISWSFNVLPENINRNGRIQKQSGSIRANYAGGEIDNSTMHISEFNLMYVVDLDWLECNAQYKKSSLENKYDQPYDRYSLGFNNNLINIKFGDSYPYIDKYALYGHHIRGVHFKFNGGPLSLNIINGITARAIQGDPTNGAMESEVNVSPSGTIISLSRNYYTFQQKLFAAKMAIKLGDKFDWDVNYVKAEDKIGSVAREISNAEIMITTSDSIFSIRYDRLLENYIDIFGATSSIVLPTKNWEGTKPRDNFIYGSNIKLNFDNSRINVNSGFSISFLNRNKWDSFQNISELDTFAIDTTLDGYFLNMLQLDNTINLSQYDNYYFGMYQQPLLPFSFQKNGNSFLDLINMSNLNRYFNLQIRYLGHRMEIGNRRHGPDYYSILNPYVKTNYSESYFSDQLNLLKNKLVLYYKRSKIIEGLYAEQIIPIETYRSTFNMSISPGIGLSTLNFGFSTSNRSNNEQKIIDQITYLSLTETDTITFVRKEETVNKLFNISMTNQFDFWGKQIISMNIVLFDEIDKVAKSVDKDTLLSIGYFSKDAKSESYGISLKSIYNNYWESTAYFSSSYYNFGLTDIDDSKIQNLHHLQLNLINHPTKYITKLIYGIHYSSGWGRSAHTNYNFRIGAETEFQKNLIISLNFDYLIKNIDAESKGTSDSFIRAYLSYNIL